MVDILPTCSQNTTTFPLAASVMSSVFLLKSHNLISALLTKSDISKIWSVNVFLCIVVIYHVKQTTFVIVMGNTAQITEFKTVHQWEC